MFGGSNSSLPGAKPDDDSSTKTTSPTLNPKSSPPTITLTDQALNGSKGSGNGSPPSPADTTEKKRRSSSLSSKASGFLASAKNSLSFSPGSRSSMEMMATTPLQKLGKKDAALVVPQGKHNNSAGDSLPTSKSTFKVGVWEDKNKKCRRTMEDTHAFLYNFLETPVADSKPDDIAADLDNDGVAQSDNGYFSIFDGHAGTFAADWCGKKLHIILEDLIKKNPTKSIPELLDLSFTAADKQLDTLPVKNSGCTAAVAVLRWEKKQPKSRSSSNSSLTPKPKEGVEAPSTDADKATPAEAVASSTDASETEAAAVIPKAVRQRMLYTANVGDARIVLCRNGKALRLSYDHKGSDENEGKRITAAGGLILNNRVNGVLAVTRALGDSYMKELVTGHPYTTETAIQPDLDEFVIIACDGIWDVCSDQTAVDLVRNVQDPTLASKKLVDHAMGRFSTDNLSCMIVRFDKNATAQSATEEKEPVPGVRKISEVDKILNDTRQRIANGTMPAIGVSATNNGRGYEPDFIPEEDWETDDDEQQAKKDDDGLVLEDEAIASEEAKEVKA